MKKKSSLIALSMIMVVSSLFAACADKKSSEPTPGSATLAPKEETKKLAPYEIKWVYIGNDNQPDLESVEKAASKYLTEKMNATLDIQIIGWGDWDSKVNIMTATNEKIDVIFTASWKNYNQNVAKKSYIAIDDYWSYMPKTKALFTDTFLNGAKINGKLWALPANKDKAHAYGFVYRQDIANKLGIDMSKVKSWNDMALILEKVKKEVPDIIPFGSVLNPTDANDVFERLDGNGVVYHNDKNDHVVKNIYKTSEYAEMTKLMGDWYKNGYLRKDVATFKGDDKADGKVFAFAEQLKPGKAEELNNSFSDKAPKDAKYGQVYLTKPTISTSDTTGSMMAISQTSKDPARAAMFLEMLNTDPYLNNLINFGVEGKHYKKVSDNVVEVIKDGGYSYAGLNWVIGNQYINYLLPNEDPQKWVKFKEFNDSAVPDRTLGFAFDTEPVKTKIAALGNVWNEYAPIYWGSIDTDKYLSELIKKSDQAGMDVVIAEKQKQYDAWRASASK